MEQAGASSLEETHECNITGTNRGVVRSNIDVESAFVHAPVAHGRAFLSPSLSAYWSCPCRCNPPGRSLRISTGNSMLIHDSLNGCATKKSKTEHSMRTNQELPVSQDTVELSNSWIAVVGD